MVHGSEVSAGPNRSNLSVKGENAVRNLDCHPVVQAARARQQGCVKQTLLSSVYHVMRILLVTSPDLDRKYVTDLSRVSVTCSFALKLRILVAYGHGLWRRFRTCHKKDTYHLSAVGVANSVHRVITISSGSLEQVERGRQTRCQCRTRVLSSGPVAPSHLDVVITVPVRGGAACPPSGPEVDRLLHRIVHEGLPALALLRTVAGGLTVPLHTVVGEVTVPRLNGAEEDIVPRPTVGGTIVHMGTVTEMKEEGGHIRD